LLYIRSWDFTIHAVIRIDPAFRHISPYRDFGTTMALSRDEKSRDDALIGGIGCSSGSIE